MSPFHRLSSLDRVYVDVVIDSQNRRTVCGLFVCACDPVTALFLFYGVSALVIALSQLVEESFYLAPISVVVVG